MVIECEDIGSDKCEGCNGDNACPAILKALKEKIEERGIEHVMEYTVNVTWLYLKKRLKDGSIDEITNEMG
jgi:hypothetical protein